MSRFQTHLNEHQRKKYLSPKSKFPARTPTAGQVLSVLGKHDFHICEIVEHKHHIWIRLGCGATISVYTTDTILVQGRIYGCGAAEAGATLRQILPGRLVWQARIDL
jgi:hypothetical protein